MPDGMLSVIDELVQIWSIDISWPSVVRRAGVVLNYPLLTEY